MDIRVKISLAAEGFKQGIGQVVSGFGQTSKAANDAADKYISANKRAESQTSSSRRAHSQEMVNGELSAIRKVESATVDSAKRIQKTYDQIPNRLPLPIVQQSARSTVKPGSDTQGLPATKNTQLEILELKAKALKLDEEAARVSARAAASQLKAEQTALEYKRRGYSAGRPKGAEETVMNLFGKDYAAAQEKQNAKIAASKLKHIREVEAAESKANAKAIADLEKRAVASKKAYADQKHVDFLNEKGGEFERSMSRTRYALYDVGRRAVAVGIGLAGMFAGAIIQAAKFESAFTSVERTLGLVRTEEGKLTAAGEKVKQSLLELARTTPVSYEDITKVATLGAQMGIAADAIDRFTSTVTKFSAITGVSVEEVSMAFGRLGQLMDVPASKFENLASAISYVGVNAVATDKEILVMSESLAAAADQAGFAADEVIGLAGAMASLKVRPEEARGVIVRLFREIDSSVAEGGKRLDDFAKIIGKSSADAADLWKQDPSQFFTSFLTGAKNAGDLNGTITALGITNSRELNVIQRLANNTDVLASTMADAHEQFILGTYVSQAYADVQDDVASKYIMLQNTIEQVSASFGDVFLPAASKVLEILKGLGESILRMPEGMKWLIGMVTALAAGFVIFQGGLALTIAGLLAVRVALAGLGETSIATMVSIKTLGVLMEQIGIKSAVANIGVVKMITTFNAARTSGMRMSGAILAAAGSLSVLQKALGVIGLLATVATITWGIVEANNAASVSARKLGDSMIEAGGGASELSDAMAKDTAAAEKGAEVYGTISGKLDDITASKEKANKVKLATGEYANEIATGFSKAADETTNYADTAKIAADAQEQFNGTVQSGTDKLNAQTFALGANVAAFTAQALAAYGENKDKNFYTDYLDPKKANLKAAAESVGFNIADMIQAGLSDDTSATEYLNGIQADVMNINSEIRAAISAETGDATSVIKSYGEAAGWTAEKIARVTDAAKANNGLLAETPGFYDDAAKAIDEMKAAAAQAAVEQALLKDTLIATGTSEAAAEDIVSGLNETLRKNAAAAISANQANASLSSAISGLIGSVTDGNTEFTTFTEDGRKNLDAWHNYMTAALDAAEALGEGTTGAVSRMVAGLNEIKNAGADVTVPFNELKDFMGNAALTAGFGDLQTEIQKATDTGSMKALILAWRATQDATTDAGQAAIDYANQLLNGLAITAGYAQSFLSGWVAEQEALNDTIDSTTEAIVTLGDYASNVGSIIEEAFTFRFGRSNALADMRTAIEDFNDRTEEARRSVRNLRDELAGKRSDKADLEAQLALAIKYGDVAGAEDIRKQLATVNEEIAASQDELAYQNGIATGSMDLNTQAGRDNYAAAQEIIQANADYVQSLINSGASQNTVNRAIADGEEAFRSQMRAMGVSQDKIDDLAAAFDDMSKIVEETPNEVNIDADTDPATRALNEFIAKANASKASVTITAEPPTKEDRLKVLKEQRTRLQNTFNKQKGIRGLEGVNAQLQLQIDSINALIASGNYASGGLIRGRGTPTSDSIPINASNGEFMMQASAVRAYGTDFMTAINQQKFGGAMPVSAKIAAGGNGPQMVYLSQEDRKLLRAAIDRPVSLYTSNKVIAESANAGNKELARRGKN